MNAELLHVVAVISNPRRFKTRYRLFENFVNHMLTFNVKLHVVECAFGNRPHYFEGKLPEVVDYIKVSSDHELWHKENLINIGVSKLPADWEYVAWIDGDVSFINPNWATETIHQLQHHPVVQVFSHVMDVGPNHEAICKNPRSGKPPIYIDHGFGYQFQHNECFPQTKDYNPGCKDFWNPGFGWACTKAAWNTFGGLIDKSICGAGDHQMAWGLLGRMNEHVLNSKTSPEFRDMLLTWQEHAKPIHNQMGYVKGMIIHHWHGKRANRKYQSRWQILIDAQYNPYKHVKYDHQGLLQIVEPNSKLMRDLQCYFQTRDEDGTDIGY